MLDTVPRKRMAVRSICSESSIEGPNLCGCIQILKETFQRKIISLKQIPRKI